MNKLLRNIAKLDLLSAHDIPKVFLVIFDENISSAGTFVPGCAYRVRARISSAAAGPQQNQCGRAVRKLQVEGGGATAETNRQLEGQRETDGHTHVGKKKKSGK